MRFLKGGHSGVGGSIYFRKCWRKGAKGVGRQIVRHRLKPAFLQFVGLDLNVDLIGSLGNVWWAPRSPWRPQQWGPGYWTPADFVSNFVAH